jgi:hypothetical protein
VQRRLAAAGLILAAAVALCWIVWALSGLYVDWLWFESLGYGSVYTKQVTSQVVLFVCGTAAFATLYFANLQLARRLGSTVEGGSADDDNLWSYLARVSAGLGDESTRGRRVEGALVAIGALLALAFGLGAAADWDVWLLGLGTAPFGLTEPFFGRDVGFYVFTMPLLRAVHGWALAAILVTAAGVLAIYLTRSWFQLGLSPRRALPVLGRSARLHLTGLGAALFLLLALDHQLALAETVLASSGQAFRLGFPGYTEASARMPAHWAMTIAAVAAAFGLLWAARRRLSRRALIGPALWVATLLVASLYPPTVQALVVKPNEAVLERPYLAHVIRMARAAYGLDRVADRAVSPDDGPSAELVSQHLATLANVRLWEPEPLRLGLNQLQAGKPYFGFPLIPDLDRYLIDGQTRALFVAARELDPQALPARSWVNTRLQFTHGYGLVAAAASAVSQDGRPVLHERDIPPRGDLGLVRPEIYFGERTTEPALVRPSEAAVDSLRADDILEQRYQGGTGVALADPLSRLAHAIRLADPNLLLSPAIGPQTALLHQRQIAERVQRVAPFLLLDSDPYPMVSDGRALWLLDGYTSSDRFPFAPRSPARLLAADPRPRQTRNVQPNYLRGSVKATVDAYDGAVNLYVVDPEDPIAAAYSRIYPGLLQPLSALPPSVVAHLRYPQQLLAVQADALARFHVSDPAQLYSGEDAWSVSRGRFDSRPETPPVYAIQRLPGEPSEEFALTIPLRPYSQANDRHNLVALLAARSDPGRYGQLLLYRYPREPQVEGPFQAELRIDQDPTVSAQFGLWQRSGAQLIRGEVQTLPLGNNVLYLESVYLQRVERAALPELQRVVAVAGGRVAMEPSLEAALSALFNVPLSLGQSTGQSARQPSPREIVFSVQERLRRAQDALLAGDRARYDQELQAAQSDLQRLAEMTR